ncbi:DUF4263 domain-containing protein [Colwellia sp. Arc7-635]|uniref:Shedu immune nuclease family protein n=1 Tax=Colwellia sp. Arc7-635 TaxID=2497879 RepID=UPI000F853FF9|nr:Shedu immune nuclease family protein [Colwellia sp. Arc7-635]AZQ85649.1 DUF4263 domain-containing protein [Colwellia sp. Arc7-635]
MKISDFIFRAPSTSLSRYDLLCRVRFFVNKKYEIVAVLTDLGNKNPSSSVTNSVEEIIAGLYEIGFLTSKAIFLEHYEKGLMGNNTFDLVTIDENNSPSWKSLKFDSAIKLLDSEDDEFSKKSVEIKELFDQIEKLRHDMDPYMGIPHQENFEVILRREKILSNQVTKSALKNAIESGATETEIHKLILSDLSLLGDMYCQLPEEYICFSEFELNGGFVDFVVLSGRSRMTVTLIEIKGANYKLINSNSYEDFSAKTNQAVQQIRKRLGYIIRNIDEFRMNVHDLRDKVENGESIFDSFIGPEGKLQVDPNKDIYFHSIVIGGRSEDDYKESRLRHDYEERMSPPIRIESWDSWLKKVPRK